MIRDFEIRTARNGWRTGPGHPVGRRIPLLPALLLLAVSGPPATRAATPVKFLTSGGQDFWPCFSPDGTRVLFSRRTQETWQLFLVPVAGGEPQRLTRSPLPVSATRANWSKQSGLIAFTGTSSRGDSRIWIMRSDGSSPHELQVGGGLSNQMFYPSWFPTGEQVAVMDAEGLVIKKVDLNTGVVVNDDGPRSQLLTGMPSSFARRQVDCSGGSREPRTDIRSNAKHDLDRWRRRRGTPFGIETGSRKSADLVTRWQQTGLRVESWKRRRAIRNFSGQSRWRQAHSGYRSSIERGSSGLVPGRSKARLLGPRLHFGRRQRHRHHRGAG